MVGLSGFGHVWIDQAGVAVKQRHGVGVLAAWTPYPFEGRHLAAVFAENTFLLYGLLEGHRVFAVFANQRLRLAARLAIEILRWCCVEVRGKAAEVDRIRGNGPASAEDLGEVDL